MPAPEIIRVSISEAAKLFGVNAQTVRRAIKNEELSYVVVQGRYKISFESLLTWSQRHMTVTNKMKSRGIGQFVDQWKIRNKIYIPNPKIVATPEPEVGKNLNLFSIQPPDRIEFKPKTTPAPESGKKNDDTSNNLALPL